MPKYINRNRLNWLPDVVPCKKRMSHWKLTLAYDGTAFHGWQIQPNLPTIQGTLSNAIYRAIGERVLPQGSGRTDAGVHALAQVASFSLQAPIPSERLQLALNRCLPASIRVLNAEVVTPSFHARHSALRKTYEYRIFPLRTGQGLQKRANESPEAVCPPTLAPFVWPCPWPLSLELLSRAAAHVLGKHDFSSFAATDPDLTGRNNVAIPHRQGVWNEEKAALAGTPIRIVTCSEWLCREGLLTYRVTATGFLHHMVRNLVGTLVQCGAGRLEPDSIPSIIEARDRSASGPTAPASGLFLVSVEYPQTDPVECQP